MVTRDRILHAALACFTEKGFTATTVSEIRTRSGASVGSIYHHFEDGKQGIAAAVYTDAVADYQSGLSAALRRRPGAEDGLRALVGHHLRWVHRDPDRARYLLSRREPEVVQATAERRRALNRASFAELEEWYRAHASAGRLREVPLDIVYSVTIGPAQEFCRHWLAGRTATPIGDAERALADAAWRALAPG